MTNHNSIFDRFKTLYQQQPCLPEYQELFIIDGIIDPELFANQPERILFIAKEHNLLKKPGDKKPYAADYTVLWKDGVGEFGQCNHRILWQIDHQKIITHCELNG